MVPPVGILAFQCDSLSEAFTLSRWLMNQREVLHIAPRTRRPHSVGGHDNAGTHVMFFTGQQQLCSCEEAIHAAMPVKATIQQYSWMQVAEHQSAFLRMA